MSMEKGRNDNPNIARYEFFMHGLWVDEASTLNAM